MKFYKANVASDLYQAGLTEDGRPFIAENYYVVIENAAGRRFAHNVFFNGAVVHFDDEEFCHYFEDVREEAKAKAEALCDRVSSALASGRSINLDLWVEVDPAYGSDEYVSQGTEAQRAFLDRLAA
jgi:hypothetical protein